MDYGLSTGIRKRRRGRLWFAGKVMSLLLVNNPVSEEEPTFLANFSGEGLEEGQGMYQISIISMCV